MDLVNIIDRLEALINTSLKLPVAQRTLLDGKKVGELIDQLRLAIPQDLKSAKEILETKDDILNHAETERRRIKSKAEEEFRARLSETEVLKEAERKAGQILEDTGEKAARMFRQIETETSTKRAESDAYVAKSLRNLERVLTSQLTSIRNGLSILDTSEQFEVIANGSKR